MVAVDAGDKDLIACAWDAGVHVDPLRTLCPVPSRLGSPRVEVCELRHDLFLPEKLFAACVAAVRIHAQCGRHHR